MSEYSNPEVQDDIPMEKETENPIEAELNTKKPTDEKGEILEDENIAKIDKQLNLKKIDSSEIKTKEVIDKVVPTEDQQSIPNVEELKISAEDAVKTDIQAKTDQQAGWDWKSWKGWGSSVINNAATQVTQLTNQVGDGLMHVLEPGGIGEEDNDTVVIPNPNSPPIKDQSQIESSKPQEGPTHPPISFDNNTETVALGTVIESNKSPWWLSGLSNVVHKTTTVFQQTTKTVVHGGLDVLEVVGKKTYDIITEGDHGLKKVIKKNRERKKLPNLSQVLSEAKEISEMRCREEESEMAEKMYMYSYWFDEYQGLLQLEAFELLCRENEIRTRQEYERLHEDGLESVKECLGRLNDVYHSATNDNDDEEEEEDEEEEDGNGEDDFGQCLMEYAAKLPVVLNVQKMLQCQEETRKLLGEYEDGKVEKLHDKDLYKESLRCMAHLTSLSIQHYHKLAQLLLRYTTSESSSSPPETSSSPPESPFANVSPIETATIIVEFSKVLKKEMRVESNKFVSALSALESEKEKESSEADENTKDGEKDGERRDSEGMKERNLSNIEDVDYNEQITSVYLEAANSVKFVARSLKLLLPALQIAIINEAMEA